MNITKGKFVACKPETSNGFVYINNELNNLGAIATCYIPFPEEEGQPEANANLIAEAFNVANELNLTPKQLADQRAELLEALKLFTILNPDHYKDIAGLINKAKEAITKATNK